MEIGGGGSTAGCRFGAAAGCSSLRGTEEEERFEQAQPMSDGFSIPAVSPLQSGCNCYVSDVESHHTSLLPTRTNQWGLGPVNIPYTFQSSLHDNLTFLNSALNLNIWIDAYRNHSSSSVSLMQMQNTPPPSVNTAKNFYPGSALQYTAGVDHPVSHYSSFPASKTGSCLCLLNDKHLDVGETRSQEECMDDQTGKIFQSRECEVLRTLQISRHQKCQSPLEEYDDLESRHTELKLILRKELTNSDVGNVGRIVLPKKEAEANLPPLFERDGMTLHMDDLILPIKWKFKYRFWPNNKSRMYILETTGDFVRTHGLQTGDCFIIYRNSSSGTYIVRGKKGIQQPTFVDVINPNYNNQCGINEDANSRPLKIGKAGGPKCQSNLEQLNSLQNVCDSTLAATGIDSFRTDFLNDFEIPSQFPLTLSEFNSDNVSSESFP